MVKTDVNNVLLESLFFQNWTSWPVLCLEVTNADTFVIPLNFLNVLSLQKLKLVQI